MGIYTINHILHLDVVCIWCFAKVQGVSRTRILWAAEESCSLLRERLGDSAVWWMAVKMRFVTRHQRLLLCLSHVIIGFPSCCFQGIEEATGIPSAKQQLKLVRNLGLFGVKKSLPFPPESGARFAEANQKLLAEGDEKQSSYEVLSWEVHGKHVEGLPQPLGASRILLSDTL